MQALHTLITYQVHDMVELHASTDMHDKVELHARTDMHDKH